MYDMSVNGNYAVAFGYDKKESGFSEMITIVQQSTITIKLAAKTPYSIPPDEVALPSSSYVYQSLRGSTNESLLTRYNSSEIGLLHRNVDAHHGPDHNRHYN